MHHEVHVVDEHPLGLGIAFHMSRAQPGFFQAQFDFIGNGLHLPRIGPAAQDKVVSKRA